MDRKTPYNPLHKIQKSEEWKRHQSDLQQAKKARRPTNEEMSSFEAALGNKLLNWQEIMVQSHGNPGWPRMRELIKLLCECGREETKLMTPKILTSPTRHLCKSCSTRISVGHGDHKALMTPAARQKAGETFAAAHRGPGTPENDFVRGEVEKTLGAQVTNWEELRFTRYGAPSTKQNGGETERQDLHFTCPECHRSSSFTFVSIEAVPSHCASCSALRAMEKRPRQRSAGELEVEAYLNSLGIETVAGLYTIAPGFETDIYLKDKDIGIEYDGLYWHSDEVRAKDYHLQKTLAAEKNGKRLIHLFEDEWKNRRAVVEKRLAHLAGKTTRVCGARECEIKDPKPGEVRQLLEDNHIQGSCIYQIAKGAYFDGRLVAVMTFSRPRMFIGRSEAEDEMELVRFATAGSIPGIASRLLKAFRAEYPQESIVSYADIRWSQGGLYKSLGFTEVRRNPPTYWYVFGGKREHRSKYAKYKLVEQGYDRTMTEEEIMRDRGFSRIWDCGTLVYRLDPQTT